MVFEQDFNYWRIIEKLVIEHDYSIIALLKEGNEILLQPKRHKHITVVRIVRVDVDWGNTLAIDIEQAGRNFQHLLRNGVRGPIHVMNVYISSLPPVDDYPVSFTEGYSIEKGKINIVSALIHREQFDSGLKKLEEALSIPIDVEQQSDVELNDIQYVKDRVINHHNKLKEEEKAIFQYGKPFLTYIFLGLQIIMFILMEMSGGSTNNETLIQFGAKFNPLIYAGEWWRFIAPIVLHIGFLHLVMNSIALYYIGPAVERAFGSLRFFSIYIVAGLAGTFASFAFSPSISAGASGAIFGCFGALLFIGLINKQVFLRTLGPNILVVIAINLAMGFVIPNIDNAGHIGGLIGGFLAALCLQLPHKNHSRYRVTGVIGLFVLFTSLYQFGLNEAKPQYSHYIAYQGQEMLQNNQPQAAYELLHEAISNGNHTNEVLLLLSVTELELGKQEEALTHLKQILSNDKDYHQAHFYLSILYASNNDYALALEHINKALKIEPNNQDYKSIKDELEKGK